LATSNKNFIVKNGLDASGSITAGENLRSTNSSGDEGGEIFLNKAVTNTTLTGGVTIDVWQNRLRFFEQGGNARGFYLDITTGGNGVSTNLAAGGGGSGTVTSVSLTVPTGLSISGSPITTSGTLAISLSAGYSIPTTTKQTNWDTAYGWGDHASAGYSLGAIYRSSSGASPTYKKIYVSTADPSTYSNPAVTLAAGDLWIQV
jgi:hypothetical protein